MNSAQWGGLVVVVVVACLVVVGLVRLFSGMVSFSGLCVGALVLFLLHCLFGNKGKSS